MTIYATLDANGLSIAEDARIDAFGTLAEAETYLRAAHQLNEGETLTIETGDFADCWIKTHEAPDAAFFAPFTADEIIIHGPGSHPGGRAWWSTPFPPVLVAVVTATKGE